MHGASHPLLLHCTTSKGELGGGESRASLDAANRRVMKPFSGVRPKSAVHVQGSSAAGTPAASPAKKNSISRTIPVSPQSRIQHGQAQLYYREVRQALEKEGEARELRKEAARIQAKRTSNVDFPAW